MLSGQLLNKLVHGKKKVNSLKRNHHFPIFVFMFFFFHVSNLLRLKTDRFSGAGL